MRKTQPSRRLHHESKGRSVREVFVPRSLDELWNILDSRPLAHIHAGGTDLLVKFRASRLPPPPSHVLVCVERISDLKRIYEHEDTVFIGSCSTHAELIENRLIRQYFPILIKALTVLGSPPIRNMGTIGGNICTASPAGDALPPLYVLDAEVEIRRRDISRRMTLKDFIAGPGKTALGKGELLYGIWIKKTDAYNINHFEKVGQRKALAIAVASLAALLKISETGIVEKARLAWGSVGPTIVAAADIDEALVGRPLTFEILKTVLPLVKKAISPIDDIRASAEYRTMVSGNLMLRLLNYTGRNSRDASTALQ